MWYYVGVDCLKFSSHGEKWGVWYLRWKSTECVLHVSPPLDSGRYTEGFGETSSFRGTDSLHESSYWLRPSSKGAISSVLSASMFLWAVDRVCWKRPCNEKWLTSKWAIVLGVPACAEGRTALAEGAAEEGTCMHLGLCDDLHLLQTWWWSQHLQGALRVAYCGGQGVQRPSQGLVKIHLPPPVILHGCAFVGSHPWTQAFLAYARGQEGAAHCTLSGRIGSKTDL